MVVLALGPATPKFPPSLISVIVCECFLSPVNAWCHMTKVISDLFLYFVLTDNSSKVYRGELGDSCAILHNPKSVTHTTMLSAYPGHTSPS